MERKQLYRVLDVETNEVVAESLVSSEVSERYGIQLRAVANYATFGRIIGGKYYLEKQNKLPPPEVKPSTYGLGIWQEWERATANIRNRVIWCDKMDKGVRKLCISAQKAR